MIRKLDLDRILAELVSLDALILDIPESDYLGQIGLQSRREELREQVAQIESREDRLARVALFFGGGPVVGSEGVKAGFASDAVGTFQDLISKMWSIRQTGTIAAAGPVRDREASQLHITHLLHGSLGFLLEEIDARGEPLFDSPLKHAADDVSQLISNFADEDEARFSSVIEEISPRVFISARNFINCIHRENATFRIVEGRSDQQFTHEAVERAWQRGEQFNVDEQQETLIGRLLGLIPIGRRFEFETDTGDVFRGKVGDAFSHSYLERINTQQFAGKRWRALVYRKSVERVGRSAMHYYTLLELNEIEAATE